MAWVAIVQVRKIGSLGTVTQLEMNLGSALGRTDAWCKINPAAKKAGLEVVFVVDLLEKEHARLQGKEPVKGKSKNFYYN